MKERWSLIIRKKERKKLGNKKARKTRKMKKGEDYLTKKIIGRRLSKEMNKIEIGNGNNKT